ncbi:uncharacterized protein LOC121780106 [Salvia splendens]|uniref:uncharacterized protein LOC121780106 n=1 Tax=Salvia splendens TaxID=180675 RepID=UPI001C25A741|nr:uncharacterized protein LOC121780106 [Salvia splendens]
METETETEEKMKRKRKQIWQCKSDIYLMSYGFGVSKISGKYKVVCTNVNAGSGSFHVYTLGTGTWRRVEAGSVCGYTFCYNAHIVCNGNLHWSVYDSTHTLWICGFDLETERVSIFSAPAVDRCVANVKLNVLRDCLCLSYTQGYKLVVWLMKDYRVGESWTIDCKNSVDFDIDLVYDFDCHDMTVHPIKLFKNGDILMLFEDKCLFYYSHETRTKQVGMLTDGNPKDAEEDEEIVIWMMKEYQDEKAILDRSVQVEYL